ncbi:hypothetical protein SAY87_030931 [Trapa incisa]|uniref:PGG domain-containing protein n=1 Tax=Trapa incisa TaxID=236973 RepID=A0AAN7KSJ4_9MYRT|nr:hypothetical protein SAY87_030931 [Trapa incisa]
MGKLCWCRDFQYSAPQDARPHDSPTKARNVLLIVAALIVAVTFQAGVNPPGGVWQENSNDHRAGQAIYAQRTESFYMAFLVCNTIALSTSIVVIISMTYKFPYFPEVWIATIVMFVTYGFAIFAVTPKSVKFRFVLIAGATPFLLRTVIHVYKVLNQQEQPRE